MEMIFQITLTTLVWDLYWDLLTLASLHISSDGLAHGTVSSQLYIIDTHLHERHWVYDLEAHAKGRLTGPEQTSTDPARPREDENRHSMKM